MPKLYLPVPEIEKSITRPVVLDIIRQVKEITGISDDTKEIFLGDARSALQPGSTVDSDILDNTNISASRQLTIEVAESYSEGYLGTVAIAQTEQIPIFVDDNLGIVLKPIYTPRNFDITVRYRNPSKNQAKAWRDNIYMHVNHLRNINSHTATYHYSIPKAFMILLEELHRMRENVAGYGEDFDTYFHNNVTRRVTEATTLAGTAKEFVIPERQFRIQGTFNFTEAPEKEQMGGETSMWISEFTYQVTIDIPAGMHVNYPVMVHNQLLDEKFIPKEPEDDTKHDKAFARSLRAIHYFEVPYMTDRAKPREDMIRIPDFDDWRADNAPPGLYPVFSALCELLPDNKKLLLNLNELGDYAIDEELLEFFKQGEYRYMTLPYKSMFHLSYYRFKFLSTDKKTHLDSELNFTSTEDLSLRDNHRVVFSIVTDISSVDPACLKRMKRFPNVLKKTLSAIRVTYAQLSQLSPVVNMMSYAEGLAKAGPTPEEVWEKFPIFYTVMNAHTTAEKLTEEVIREHNQQQVPVYKTIQGN